MGAVVGAGHQNIIKIDEGKVDGAEDAIHEPLECLRRILEAKRHPQEFKQSKRRNNGGLRNIVGRHWNLIEAADKVDD